MRIRLVVRGPTVTSGSLVCVPKSLIRSIDRIRDELTFSNGAHWQAKGVGVSTDEDSKVYCWEEDERYIYVPRHFDVTPFLIDEDTSVVRMANARTFGKSVGTLPFNGELRNDVQEKAARSLARPGDKILALGCGVGKTVVALHSLNDLDRYPALVCAHTNDLLDQWSERIVQFLPDLKDSIGRVQGPVETWDYRDRQITLATLQTLARYSTKAPLDFRKYFRLVVFDEVHRLGAQGFSRAASMFYGERWGLSATLKRADGMDRVIKLHCGDVSYEYLEQELKAQVYFVPTGFGSRHAKFMYGKIHLPRTFTALSRDEDRRQMILGWITSALEADRNVLILGERVEELWWLHDNINHQSKSVCTGEVKDRKDALSKKVVFATQHLAKEGLDQPRFDTLFNLYPFASEGRLRQSIGRILRVVPGKRKPVVIVFEDNISILQALCKKMRKASRELGFEVFDMKSNAVPKRRS